MLLRPQWSRLRRHWVCFGVGTVCATGMALSGCSRAPMARFKEMTSAAPDAAEAPSATRSASAERPGPGDAVAAARAPAARRDEGRVTIAGDPARRGAFQRYREGYADLSDRILNRDTKSRPSADPFLDAGVDGGGQNFPATDALAPTQRPAGRTPGLDDSVARADLRPERPGVVSTASVQRPSGNEGMAHTAPPQPQVSRLEQLRAELRAQREGVATTGTTPQRPSVAESDRGTVLSGAGQTGEGIARVSTPAPQGSAPQFPETPSTAAGKSASTSRTTDGGSSGNEDTALRVQSLLASAEWLAQRGDLEEAYRNAILAQHLAEYAGLRIDPQDRQPVEVTQRIWEQIQQRDSSSELALNLPKPQLPSGASRRAVPQDAFPGSERTSWQKSASTADLAALPVISPQGKSPPALAAPGTTPAPSAAPAEPPVSPPAAGPTPSDLPQVAQAPAANPVTLSAITAEPAVPPASSVPPTPNATARASAGVVTALAETPSRSTARDPAGLTVPAMASLPKVERVLPLDGPALGGPQLAKSQPADAPPFLEVIGARQLPTDEPEAVAAGKPRRLWWALGGLSAVLLGAAYGFRRRWSAGGSKLR